jgi:hypothetical protein
MSSLPKLRGHQSVSTHKMAHKFQKMLSKDNTYAESEMEFNLRKKFTQMIKDKSYQDNIIWGNSESFESAKHQDYLDTITVSIDF